MATHLTRDQLLTALASSERIFADPFGVLKSISPYVNDAAHGSFARELVLRALDQRPSFGNYAHLLDAMAQSVGLYPYIASPDTLNIRDSIAYEFHRPPNLPSDVVFHREQAEVFRRLMNGDNVILSAPTSFGKSKIIDAVIASGKYNNLAIIVPTLALIDETRRRLAAFSNTHKIITHVSQRPANRNAFVFTAERAVAYEHFPKIDFFAIDEFYKIGAIEEDESRTVALNQVFYTFRKDNAQFYLLGPNIDRIPEGMEKAYRCFFYPTDYQTVVAEQVRVPSSGTQIERLLRLAKTLEEPTLIYCNSPPRANAVAMAFLENNIGIDASDLRPCAEWAAKHYHPEWIFGRALTRGIGIHHGKLPRSLAHYVVKAFNDERLRFLVCTSTLIEGVNTKAKNVIIYDNKIAKRKLDYFTFNNITGRSGRMFQHFIGKVFLFSDAPQKLLPFVDFPVFTQQENAPDSLLIHIDDTDLSNTSKERLEKYADEKSLPLDLMRANSSIPPADQVAMAQAIEDLARGNWRALLWRRFPSSEQLQLACDLIWRHFVHRGRQGVLSANQLKFKILQLQHTQSIAARARDELKGDPRYSAESPDEAVERVLEFDRTWAEFEMPRFLLALSSIQGHVLKKLNRPAGDYRFFAAKLQCHFKTAVIAALDEYGIPLPIAEKLQPSLQTDDDLDKALGNLRALDTKLLRLTRFEREIVRDAQRGL
jgi:hypothetical protein